MNRSERRAQMRGLTSVKPDLDKPDLSGIDMTSKVTRFILIEATMPDGLFPEEVTEGMVKTLNKETHTGPPWLQMEAKQAYPGDIVGDGTGLLLGDVADEFVDMLLDAMTDEQIRRVASITLQRVEHADGLAAAKAHEARHAEGRVSK